MIVVSDTSAITALIQIERTELLLRLFDGIIIPAAVEKELRRTHTTLPDFIRVVPVIDPSLPLRFADELDVGESEAIALMLEGRGDLLLMDERKGRRVAKRECLKVVGLLGVLVAAKSAGLLNSLRPVIEELERTVGFRIGKELRDRLLREDNKEE
ncbi:DUF3368 domain-containing protein [bacterium]|nr:DUF3368 domain-containing protein [bacterium]